MPQILLTGATGYLGSHLARTFLENGYSVAVLKRSTSKTSRLDDISSQFDFFDTDIDGVRAPFESLGYIDAVVHTSTCYGRNNESPLEIFRANTQFPLELLAAANSFKVGTFFNSDTTLSNCNIPYVFSKKQFRQWGKHIADIGTINFVNIRLEHFYGPGDDASKFTTWVIRQCLASVASIPLTNGEQERDFIYIDDVVSAYLLLLKQASGIKQWLDIDLGSGQKITIRDFVEMVHELTHSKSTLNFGALPYREGEYMESKSDISYMNEIGWKAEWDLLSGLRKSMEGELNK